MWWCDGPQGRDDHQTSAYRLVVRVEAAIYMHVTLGGGLYHLRRPKEVIHEVRTCLSRRPLLNVEGGVSFRVQPSGCRTGVPI